MVTWLAGAVSYMTGTFAATLVFIPIGFGLAVFMGAVVWVLMLLEEVKNK